MSAAGVALVAPEHPALVSLIGQPMSPAELLVRLARCGLDLMPRRSDAALLSRTSKASPVRFPLRYMHIWPSCLARCGPDLMPL